MKKLIAAFIILFGILVLIGMITSAVRQNTGTAASQPPNTLRRLEARTIQDHLLRAGFDVQVSVIEEDDSRIIIYGKSVNRPFVYNLMARRDFKKLLHEGKFTEVTFMDSMQAPEYVQAYRVR